MNRELRKAIYNKQMLRNKFEKYHRQNMGGIQKTTQPCYKTEKKICQNIFFREVYRRSQGK